MKVAHLLGGENGWGGAPAMLLLLAFGFFALFVSVADLREAARLAPQERDCSEWMAEPSGARWVSLSGCRLNLKEAASRRWKGWASTRDGGAIGARYLELFIPLFVGLQPDSPPRAVLATSDKALLSLMDMVDRLEPEEVPAYLEANEAAWDAVLAPAVLTGYVEPLQSLASRSALTVLTVENAVVLEQGKEPPRANAVFGFVVGLIALTLSIRTIIRRAMMGPDEAL